jgi:carbamoyl-phosphate synthase large subunit
VNVLITSASRKVGLVRAFQAALATRGGGTVIAADTSSFAAALYVAGRHRLTLASTDSKFLDQILELCQQEGVSLVIPTRDEELPIFAAARARFEKHGIRVMTADPETVRICQDKLAFVEFCRAHGFATPYTYSREQWSAIEFPAFVKPRFGKGAKGARRVNDKSELNHALRDADHWLVQEFIESPEYTIDLFANFDGKVLSAVPRLRQLVVAGESYVSRTVKEAALIEEPARLATKLRLIGHNTIQCFWDGQQLKFIEVNPRFGGAAALGIAAGADTPTMLLRLLAGEAPPAQLGGFQNDLVMLRFTQDLFLNASELASPSKDRAAATDAKASALTSSIQAVLFDLDNTLYPEEQFVVGGFRAAAQLLADRLKLTADPVFERMLEILPEHGRGKVFDLLLKELEIEGAVWRPVLLQAYRCHRPALSLFLGTEASLRTLRNRGLRLGLVTDGMASVQRRKIAALGLDAYMDAIVCTDELGRGCAKPSIVPFEVALKLLDVAPEAAAYIADDLSKDFAGPNQLHMKTAQIRSEGLIGVWPAAAPVDPIYQPQLQAESLNDALKRLDLL